MFRDKIPLHSLGYGVTNRDYSSAQNEEQRPPSSGGAVSRFLNDKPIVKYLSSTAATLAATFVLNKGLSKGGVKLATTIQRAADSGSHLGTRAVKTAGQIRKTLDELEGLNRYIEDAVDPYARLINRKADGSISKPILTKLAGPGFVSDGTKWMTAKEFRAASSGKEPAAIWSYRDQLQQSLVRNSRSLAIGLPSTYIVQRGVTGPLFGNDDDRPRGKWYNPVDVITDFVTQSTRNITDIVLPTAVGGAAVNRMKSLMDAPYQDFPFPLTKNQKRTSNKISDLKTILDSFGQDAGNLANQAMRITSSASNAFNISWQDSQAKEGGFVNSLSQARRGAAAARAASELSGEGKLRAAAKFAKAGLFGRNGDVTTTSGTSKEDLAGLFDTLPAIRNVPSAIRSFGREFKKTRNAYDVISGAISFDEGLRRASGDPTLASDILNKSIVTLRSQHTSRFIHHVGASFAAKSMANPDGTLAQKGTFAANFERNAYNKTVVAELVRRGYGKEEAEEFVSGIKTGSLPSPKDTSLRNISQRITYGVNPITTTTDEDFFQQLAKRAKKDLGTKAKSFEGQTLQEAFTAADRIFSGDSFRVGLAQRAELSYAADFQDFITDQASGILRPQKALFGDFTGQISSAKQNFLSRKVAQASGVKLTESDGSLTSGSFIANELAKRGIDASDADQLKQILIDKKLMTRPSDIGGYNLLGLREISVDTAFDKGIFSHLPADQQLEARRIFSNIARKDPVSRTIGYTSLQGVYENASGRIVDTTKARASARSFLDFVTDQTKIPLVNFNPLQMLGFGGPKGINKNKEFEILPGTSRQPFLAGAGGAADVYVWSKNKNRLFGDTGSLFTVTQGKGVTAIAGKYKRVSSIETDLYARATRLASGREPLRATQVEGGKPSRLERFKRAFDIDEDQPNSIFRFAGRFKRRYQDINNPQIMTELMSRGEVTNPITKRSIRLEQTDDGVFSVVDQSGKQLYNHTDVLKAFDSFRVSTELQATPRRAMREFENTFNLPNINVGGGRAVPVSEMQAGQELVTATGEVVSRYESLKGRLRSRGIQTEGLTRQVNRLKNLAEDTDILSEEQIKNASPSIINRADRLRNVLHRTLLEMHAYENMTGNPTELAIKIEEALARLAKDKLLSPNQLTEARAAALSTVLNISSFRNFSTSLQNGENSARTLKYLIDQRTSNPDFAKTLKTLVSPYTSQKIANVGATGFTRYSSIIRPMTKRLTSVSPYQINEMAENPLGNSGLTFVPTFGTVLDRALSGETSFTKIGLNVLGANTYSDPNSFSAASIPSIHLNDRLNRYPGSIGLAVDPEKYSSPLSFFAGGLIGKRVLPIFAAGATAIAVDRTIGGYTQPKDSKGERVYTPYFGTKLARGAVEAQSIFSGVTPGGMSYAEKKEQLLDGEVAVRQGRYWPLGVTPFKGGKVMYYRPSYYRKMQEAGTYTPESFGTPMEKLAFGYDFSPLRPFDPYRYERKNYYDRPYPVTGEYFTGPFGPITPALNLTVGKILKPQIKMHEEEVSNALSQYVPAGAQGAYNPTGIMSSGRLGMGGGTGSIGYSGSQSGNIRSSSMGSGLQIGSYNNSVASSAGATLDTARNISFNTISTINQGYIQPGQYGPPPVPGFIPPSIAPAGQAASMSGSRFQMSEMAYRTQEMAGIYGFSFSSLRDGLGFGNKDFQPNNAILQSSSKAYGVGRSFWDMNLGGMGDVPLGMKDGFSGLELSEITRRFIPKERTDVTYLNPIRNTMGQKYPFLPGADYFTNLQTGDPYSKIQEGELRLPGTAYERFNPTRRDYTSPVTQLDILGDVAPYSRQYRALDRQLTMGMLEPSERVEVEKIRGQVAEVTRRNTFKPYQYKYNSAEELGISQAKKSIGGLGEYLAHKDTFINNKFFPSRTAQEDWERRNVYGATFPEWQSPIDSFIKPMYYKSTQRNPLVAATGVAFVGSLMGKTPTARAVTSAIGFSTSLAYSSYQNIKQKVTGDRFIPKPRKEQMALEEYTDILSYVKNRSLANEAAQAGDNAAAAQFTQAAKRTMYGADLYNSSMPSDSYGNSIDTLSLAIPKRKREHFKAMIAAPEQERDAILSTAPRLERRIYQAAWGRPVEEKPDLTEFFSRHELPDLSWEGWHPNTSMEHVKIKMGQNAGVNMSQMGYYPQQIREANLTNPSYPNYESSQNPENTAAQLRLMMSRNGINGSVTPVRNNGGGSGINISSGLAGLATLL